MEINSMNSSSIERSHLVEKVRQFLYSRQTAIDEVEEDRPTSEAIEVAARLLEKILEKCPICDNFEYDSYPKNGVIILWRQNRVQCDIEKDKIICRFRCNDQLWKKQYSSIEYIGAATSICSYIQTDYQDRTLQDGYIKF